MVSSTTPRELVLRAVWHRSPPPDPDSATLAEALRLARRNQVEGVLCRAYPTHLAAELTEIVRQHEEFRRNLDAVSSLLRAAGVEPILIKAPPGLDYVYSNFDLVVGDDGWQAAIAALAGWAVRRSTHPLEQVTKLLMHPPVGPAAHLHRAVAWFDIPVVPTDRLRARAHATPDGDWLVPAPADELRIMLAHAVFQNMAIDLAELLTVHALSAEEETVRDARSEATREGWRRGFDDAWAVAESATARLGLGEDVRVPVRLPIARSLLAGAEHARGLHRSGRRKAAWREALLRVPLVLAKQRHLIRG